jgi:capsular polysaccharide export protein
MAADSPESPGASAPVWHTVAVFPPPLYRGIAGIPNLTQLVGAARVLRRPADAQASAVDVVLGWGEKTNTAAAVRYADRHNLAYWRAEDGFVRSLGLGVTGDAPLSIVLDDRGIYYDARTPSRLEAMLQGDPRLDDPELCARARRAIDRICDAGISKYNNAPAGVVRVGPTCDGLRVLVVDQTRGDLSVGHGLAGAASFDAMLDAALDENPGAQVLVKTHPDVVAGKKRGYFDGAGVRDRVTVIGDAVNPIRLIDQVDRVYVVTSQLGFEAVMAGKPVTCFGAPFYAGWGLTDDRAEIPRRTARRTVEQVFAAAYLLYARYVDPDTGRACEHERVVEHLALQRQLFEQNRGDIFCFGFRFWKRNYVRAFLRSPGNRVVFPRDAQHAERLGFGPSSRLLVWGQRAADDVQQLADRHGVPVWRMEDGFLRSVGLGSDLATPASLVVDREGIYYDPTRPSELESLLLSAAFTGDELVRAAALRETIVRTGLSKYNVGDATGVTAPTDRRVILVPGQVEDDASIQLGCRDVRTNTALLEHVRAANPDAHIIYKPHPDVVSGNRQGAVARAAALAHCDHVETGASLAQCLAVADEVHTLTSLVGFEALLRGLRVVTYGQPFYSGWGLTEDRHPVERRTRRLTLDELVAGTLLRYPRYLNRSTGQFTTPEAIVAELQRERDAGAGAGALRVSWPRRQLRKLVHAYRGVMHAP